MGHVRRIHMGRRLVDEHEHFQLRINEHNIYYWLSEKTGIPCEIYGRCLSMRMFYIQFMFEI